MGKNISNWKKFYLLLWKNFELLKGNLCQLICECIWPIFFALLIMLIRYAAESKFQKTKHFREAEMVEGMTKIDKTLGLAFSPTNEFVTQIMLQAQEQLKARKFARNKVNIKSYKNAEALNEALVTKNYFAGVQFDDSYASLKTYPKSLKFNLRFPSQLREGFLNATWNTEHLFPKSLSVGPRNSNDDFGGTPVGYIEEGFILLQHVVTMGFIRLASATLELPQVVMQRFPYPPYIDDPFVEIMKDNIPLFFIISFIATATNIARFVAEEKEKQLKEVMKIMGLPNWLHWFAWFIRFFATLFLIAILLITLFKLELNKNKVFTYSDRSVILLFFIIYFISIICFSFMMAVFFKTKATAAVVTGLIFIAIYFPYRTIEEKYEQLSLAEKLLACLNLNFAQPLAFRLIFNWEGIGEGASWSNLFSTINEDENLALGHVMLMMLLTSVIYLLICLYVEQIYPGEFGVPKKWNFPFTQNFWCPHKKRMSGGQNAQISENEPKNKHIGVEIKSLAKRFGKFWAVKGLTLNMYEDEITVLLGHNGAGKTTTISMLTGMYPPTTGTALINGFDIRTDIDSARASMGICPQINVLFDDMSVENHIRFFSKLKGLKPKEVKDEIDRYLEMIQLKNKAKQKSKTLSGGMKRKLSLCCALCGHSKVVFCDEPSSGMDPSARRQLWNLLQAEKVGRTILLTTHFMDEADVLGDRIAIMCKGDLKCVGTSFFLKKKYGSGYRLICVKKENCSVAEVTTLLQKYIQNIKPESEIGSELTYRLPEGSSEVFGKLFRDLEDNLEKLKLDGFGIGITSMEEVFMKVGAENVESVEENVEVVKSEISLRSSVSSQHRQDSVYHDAPDIVDDDQDDNIERNNIDETDERKKGGEQIEKVDNLKEDDVIEDNFKEDGTSKSYLSDKETERKPEKQIKGATLLYNQFHAMFYKKIHYTWRNIILLLLQIILALLFVGLAILSTLNSKLKPLPTMTFSLTQYSKAVTALEIDKNVEENSLKYKIAKEYEKLIKSYGSQYEYQSTNGGSFENFILKLSKDNQVRINKEYLAAATINEKGIKVWFNNQPLHTAPLALNLVHNAIARTLLGANSKITVANNPIPFTEDTFREKSNKDSLVIVLLVGFGLADIAAIYIILLIKESVSRCKLLQLVSGARTWIYWLTHFLWDLFTFICLVLIILICLAIAQIDNYKTIEEFGRFFLIMLCFGFAVLPLVYVFSFFFTQPATGFAATSMIFFFTGFILLLVLAILKELLKKKEDLLNDIHHIFLTSPNYALTYGWWMLVSNTNIKKDCKKEQGSQISDGEMCKMKPDCCVPYFGWKEPGILAPIVIMLATGFVLLLLIILKETCRNMTIWKSNLSDNKSNNRPTKVDDDVEEEKKRVKEMSKNEISKHYLVLDGLTKIYGTFIAVKNISLAVKGQVCFGLLGVNGAGKTSTFKMLTGEVNISSGDAYVRGISVKKNMTEVYKNIGYCPQFDALLDDLTGRETLYIFCLLRGIPKKNIQAVSDGLADELGFTKHMNKCTKVYSLGNKRKLSTAIAIIGRPSVIYLDEPTSGMDPASRRQLWNVICSIRESGKLIILTSHSMDECEALCTRLAIMVNGEFKCIGSTQHLKNKFSKGVVLKIQTERLIDNSNLPSFVEMQNNVNKIKNAILNKYDGAIIESEYQNLLTFYIPLTVIKWSEIFTWLEENRKVLRIEDYSLSQTSLEDIFLEFASAQFSDKLNKSKHRQCCC